MRFVLPLGGSACLLALHVWVYRFLTDDAFISFRYARNFAEGSGLVYNPGDAPVEGYTNFLWVVMLAGFARLGAAPETVALVLGVALTAVAWLGTAWVGLRLLAPAQRPTFGLLAPIGLALNRSFAVWSTGGLETRLLEVLLLAGVVALYIEMRRTQDGRSRRLPWASVFLSLAVLTRPDALSIGAGALLARDLWLWRVHRLRRRETVLGWAIFVIPIATHLVWRLFYYGQLLPNTYYAKLDGNLSIHQGLMYLAMLSVEYALPLWIPFLIDGIRACRERAPGLVPVLCGALVPFLAYVVCAGGDHFEYRIVDLFWIPLALLLQAGVGYRATRLARRSNVVLVYAAAIAVLGASAVLPVLSHLQYPSELLQGFPGVEGRITGNRDLVQLALVPRILRAPGPRQWIELYDGLGRRLTARFAALRQEEHRGVAALTAAQGRALRSLVDQGYLPGETRLAVAAAGAIPYYSRLWSLDRLGLCDAHIAHGPWYPGVRMMAHGKVAPASYLVQREVDLSAMHPVRFIVHDEMVLRIRSTVAHMGSQPFAVARLGPDKNLLVYFPMGVERELPRFPRLRFEPLADWQTAQAP